MSILKENDEVRKLLRSDIWAKAGYTGKGKVVVILDDANGKPYKDMESYYIDVFGTATETGHPTRVAFTIHEFAYDVKILYFDYTRNKDKVYEWLKAHKDEINFINVSMVGILGRETPDYLRIMELGIPMICAVGNDDSEKWISYPARYQQNVAVGATDKEGKRVKDYSNEGQEIDTVVPSGIYIKRDDGYIWANDGTSFSSPTLTGLLVQYDEWRTETQKLNKMTPEEAEELSHKFSEDIEEKGYDFASGYGLFRLPLEIPQTEIKTPEYPKYWRIQCGAYSFDNKNGAKSEQIKLKSQFNLDTYLVYIDGLWKIQLGAFEFEQNCRNESQRLKNLGIDNFVVYY